ncbi:MAG: XdhC/CoxI family protein [Chloroflexota bacterium]
MPNDYRAVYEAILTATKQGTPSALATVITSTGSIPRHAGSKMLIYADGSIIGTIGGGKMESKVIATGQTVIASGDAQTVTYTLNSMDAGDPGICGGTATIFIEPIAIPATILVIGAGHVGQAVAELAKWMGYRVILSDDRAELCNSDIVAGLDGYLVTSPASIVDECEITTSTYIVTVTRGLPIDEQLLPKLVLTDAPYIGLIGSRRRWAITAKTLREKYKLTEDQIRRIQSPIGLELEAETPKEIALSIMAEIVMQQRGGTGQPMQWHGKLNELD